MIHLGLLLLADTAIQALTCAQLYLWLMIMPSRSRCRRHSTMPGYGQCNVHLDLSSPRTGNGRCFASGPCEQAMRRYLNALQTTAQHLLRYLAAAVVVNKRRRNAMKDLIRVIEQEAYEYSDPITQFLECLFVRYDFEGAQVGG